MIDDPKILALSDGEFRLLLGLWCMASESNKRGLVYIKEGIGPDPVALASHFRIREFEGDDIGGMGPEAGFCAPGDMTKRALNNLEHWGLIRQHDGGVIEITNFDLLQKEAEREDIRRHERERKREQRTEE